MIAAGQSRPGRSVWAIAVTVTPASTRLVVWASPRATAAAPVRTIAATAHPSDRATAAADRPSRRNLPASPPLPPRRRTARPWQDPSHHGSEGEGRAHPGEPRWPTPATSTLSRRCAGTVLPSRLATTAATAATSMTRSDTQDQLGCHDVRPPGGQHHEGQTDRPRFARKAAIQGRLPDRTPTARMTSTTTTATTDRSSRTPAAATVSAPTASATHGHRTRRPVAATSPGRSASGRLRSEPARSSAGATTSRPVADQPRRTQLSATNGPAAAASERASSADGQGRPRLPRRRSPRPAGRRIGSAARPRPLRR